MIYLLYGEDEFSLEEGLSSIKEGIGPAEMRDFNIAQFDGDELSLELLTATCDTVPFMAEKRLVIARGLLSLFETRAPSRSRAPERAPRPLGEWGGLAAYLPRVPETTDLVFTDARLTSSNPLLTAIKPHVSIRTFPAPRANELRQWIRGRAMDRHVEIEPSAIDALAEAIGSDLRVVAGELEKLSIYRGGAAIREEDVEELVSHAREASIFAAVDAMLEGRLEAAIRLLSRLLQSGSPPGYILAMMARQVRLLILAKELKSTGVPRAEHGRRLGLSGYPLRKTLEQEAGFSAERLSQIHRSLLEADLRLKTTATSEELILDVLMAELASTGRGSGRG